MSDSTIFSVEDFPGLDLRSPRAGCVDLLNVEFDSAAPLQSRLGSELFADLGAAGAASIASGFNAVSLKNQTNHTLVGYKDGAQPKYTFREFSGANLATANAAFERLRAVSWGSPSADYVYFTDGTTTRRWDGTTVTAPAGMPTCWILAVQPNDNRLVSLGAGTDLSKASRAQFSNAGAAETWTATDWVDLTPGDGEFIMGGIALGEYLFVFKRSRFFVFYGNSVDSTGNAMFNYRTVDNGVGLENPESLCVGPDGIYFFGRDGIYRTAGGPAQKISSPLDPFFIGRGGSSFWQGGTCDTIGIDSVWMNCSLAWLDGRLHVCIESSSATYPNLVFVWYPTTNKWTVWNLPATAIWVGYNQTTERDELYYGAAATDNVRRVTAAATTDAGAAIVSRYRTGFTDFGAPGHEKQVNRIRLWGTGTVDYKGSRDFGSLGTAEAAALGASPINDLLIPGTTQAGMTYSFELSASSGAWTVHNVVQQVNDRGLGHRTP